MFDKVGNLPMHALVLHLTVVAIPLSALLAILFVIPRFRTWARWPLGLVSLGTLVACFVTKESGEALEADLKITPDSPVAPLIAKHAGLADQLFLMMIGFAVIAVLSAFLVSRKNATPGGAGRILNVVLPVLLVVAAVLVSVWVVRVGDAGAHAVWNPTGTVQY